MYLQEKLIKVVEKKCENHQAVAACLMYGSFTKGEGDQYSDIEFYVFLKDEETAQFNAQDWVADIAPYELFFKNEYGTEVVVFTTLIRGEFHFLSESNMEIIQTFKETGVFPDTESMLLYDTTGKLKTYLDYLKGDGPERMTSENVDFAFNNFVNAWLLGVNVLKRGELARALECLSNVQQYTLRLIRVREETVERWLNATKKLEDDLSVGGYSEYTSITSKLEIVELSTAYMNALQIIEDLVVVLRDDYQFDVNLVFLKKLRSYVDNS